MALLTGTGTGVPGAKAISRCGERNVKLWPVRHCWVRKQRSAQEIMAER